MQSAPTLPNSEHEATTFCPACGNPLAGKTLSHFGYPVQECPKCGMWSWIERTAADYDAVYETAEYEEEQINPFVASESHDEFLRHPTYAPFFREVPFVEGASLLDVGCGVGRFLAAARSIGWKCRGTDVSQKAVEIGRAQAGLDLSGQTLDELRAANVRFHAVTAFEVLEHVREPVELVTSAMALLHDGGCFFCTVPNRESPTVLKTRRPDWLPPVHLQFFTQSGLQKLLERAGGSNVKTGLVVVTPQHGRVVTKIRRLLKHVFPVVPDPLGIWGMAKRTND